MLTQRKFVAGAIAAGVPLRTEINFAKTSKPAEITCFYEGPGNAGGQFMILTEAASGPQVDAMLNRRGSTPLPCSGLAGGTYKEGTIVFPVPIKSTDQTKLQTLVTEIRHNPT